MAAARPALLLVLIYLGFISLGLPDGGFGAAWPQIHRTLGLPIGVGGAIVLVSTLVSAAAGFLSGRIIGRFTTGPVVLTSCVLTSSALLIISQAQGLGWLLAAAVPLGLGAGAVDAGLNGYVARHYSGRHMNWLHACWGIGATLGPIVIAQSLGGTAGWRGGYLFLGGAQMALALLFLLSLRLWAEVPERALDGGTADRPERWPRTPADSPAGWLSAAIFVLYVSVETTIGVWAGSILAIGRGVPQETAGLCVAVYYGAITAARIGVGFVIERWSNRRVVATGLAIAWVGSAVFAIADRTSLAAVGLLLLGLGFAPVYPGLMHEVPRRFAPEAVQTVIGRQTGAAFIGAASLPALSGWIAQYSLESIPWIACVGALVLLAAVRRLDRIT